MGIILVECPGRVSRLSRLPLEQGMVCVRTAPPISPLPFLPQSLVYFGDRCVLSQVVEAPIGFLVEKWYSYHPHSTLRKQTQGHQPPPRQPGSKAAVSTLRLGPFTLQIPDAQSPQGPLRWHFSCAYVG